LLWLILELIEKRFCLHFFHFGVKALNRHPAALVLTGAMLDPNS
jgi:hypothetical protein|tara:strand:+ start:882 stop:1013 length:132 start_codon:yes stop_codon:yes gene_type:complete